jgi:hypothetical protein
MLESQIRQPAEKGAYTALANEIGMQFQSSPSQGRLLMRHDRTAAVTASLRQPGA